MATHLGVHVVRARGNSLFDRLFKKWINPTANACAGGDYMEFDPDRQVQIEVAHLAGPIGLVLAMGVGILVWRQFYYTVIIPRGGLVKFCCGEEAHHTVFPRTSSATADDPLSTCPDQSTVKRPGPGVNTGSQHQEAEHLESEAWTGRAASKGPPLIELENPSPRAQGCGVEKPGTTSSHSRLCGGAFGLSQ